MKTVYSFGIALLLGAGLLSLAHDSEYDAHQTTVEQQAMNSLGYTAIVRTAGYPDDRYAMPEPFASEQLVTYAIRNPEYKSNFALFNFNIN